MYIVNISIQIMNYLFFKNQTIALYSLHCTALLIVLRSTNSNQTNWNQITFYTNLISSFLTAARKHRKYQHLHGL